MQSGRDDFVKQLRSAFPAEAIRGDAAFAQWGGTYLDAVPFEQAIDGRTWEQLDREYIFRRNDALGFLSTQQLVQILPIYLLSIIEEGVMSPALDAVLVKLTRPTREPGRERRCVRCRARRTSMYSGRDRAALARRARPRRIPRTRCARCSRQLLEGIPVSRTIPLTFLAMFAIG